jgi:methanogenic corrinoid protein MtbC1
VILYIKGDETSMELSSRINQLRKSKKYTQKELASLLGVAQTTIANYEQGIRIPDSEKIRRLADIFEVSIDYLMGRDIPKTDMVRNMKSVFLLKENIEDIYAKYINCLLKGSKEEARQVIINSYEKGITIKDIYFNILAKALKEVGTLWEKGEVEVWKEHYITEVTIDIMKEVKVREKRKTGKAYKMISVAASAELHNIGLRMLSDFLEIEGWNIVYLGSNVPLQSLINAIKIEKPNILALSITLEHHIDIAKNMIAAIKSHFGKNTPKIIIGGTAFQRNKNLWKHTGADYYGLTVEDILGVFPVNKKVISKP